MIKKLKRKFILIVMTLVGLVLAGVLGMSLYSTYVNQQNLINEALDRNLEGSIDSVPVIGAQHEPGDGKQHGNMLALGIEISSEGVVLQTSDAPVNINTSVLKHVIKLVLKSNESQGTIRKNHVSWKSATTATGSIRIALVDTSAVDATFQNTLIRDLEIIVIGLLVLSVITWFLADWALKPVKRAWEQQQRFVADASHELKTPLAVIIANTQILEKDTSIPASSKRWIDSTEEESRHMKALVNDLLQLARADESSAGITDALKRDDVDFSDLVGEAALEFDAVAFERGITIDDDVTEGIHVNGDSEWLERLVKILIDNAVKYADANSTVSVTLSRKGGKGGKAKGCVLKVNNRGNVISPEDLKHIFDRFYRSDKARSRTDGQGGFGLGLAIAKGITEAHGGSIACTSTAEAGTTFTVTL